MNKMAGLVTMLAFLMLFTFVAPVLAAPEEKVDFALYIRGSTPAGSVLHANGNIRTSPDNRYPPTTVPPQPPPVDYAVGHYIDAPFTASNVWIVVNGETIPFSRITYTATIDGNFNWLAGISSYRIDEVVTIFSDTSKSTVWGTLEIHVVDTNVPWPSLGAFEGNFGTFVGHGTGALDGVKVQGNDGSYMVDGVRTRVRGGLAVDWP